MKYLLVILVVGLVLWLMFGKSRRAEQVRRRNEEPKPQLPAQMVRCAHCAMHLPAAEAVSDADGRPYCGEAHRKAGPRAPS